MPGDMAMAIAKSWLQNEARKQQRGCALVFQPDSTPPLLALAIRQRGLHSTKAGALYPFLLSFLVLFLLLAFSVAPALLDWKV